MTGEEESQDFVAYLPIGHGLSVRTPCFEQRLEKVVVLRRGRMPRGDDAAQRALEQADRTIPPPCPGER